jgi:hypothetical protein
MTDRLTTLLLDSVDDLVRQARMPEAAVLYGAGRRRRRTRAATVAAAVVVAIGVAVAAVPRAGTDRHEQLADDAAERGPFTVTVSPFSNLGEHIETGSAQVRACAGDKTRRDDASGSVRYTVADVADANTLFRCLWSAAPFAVHLSDADDNPVRPARAEQYALREGDLKEMVRGTLRMAGVDQIQTWVANFAGDELGSQQGPGLALCYGRAINFDNRCGKPGYPDDYFNTGPKAPATAAGHLVGGFFTTDARSGMLELNGRRVRAAVVHYDQFPHAAVVVTTWPYAYTPGELKFIPDDGAAR